jgi:ABC-type multidrug transport system ATPase subunit
MDEPLLGLSPLLQADLARAIKGIRQQGITILVTEQFARTLLPVIDRGYVIENGILVLFGTGKELLNRSMNKKWSILFTTIIIVLLIAPHSGRPQDEGPEFISAPAAGILLRRN